MGNKKRHQKIFNPTDDELTEKIEKSKAYRKKYGVIDYDKKSEWRKQRKYAFNLIFKELLNNSFGEFEELEDVGHFHKIYIRITKLIEDIEYYSVYMPEWNNVDKVKVMKVLIEAMIEKDRFEWSYLTKENYSREAKSIKESIEVIQSEYLDRIGEMARKLNQPLPRLTEYRIPLHPNDNYKIALDKLCHLSYLNMNRGIAENLLEVALNMKSGVKTTKYRQRIIAKSTNRLTKDLYESVDDICSHLPKEAQEAFKEIIAKTIDKFIPKA